MTPTILLGLMGLGMGAFGWAISGILSRFASGSYAYLRPNRDKEAFRRGNVTAIRVLASFFLLIGIAALAFGLVTRP